MQRHIIFILITLLALTNIGAGFAPSPLPEPPDPPPVPGDTSGSSDDSATGASSGGGVGSIIQRIFHIIRFPTETLAESLTIVLNEAAEKEAARLSGQTAQWAAIIGDVIQAPSDGFYEVIATSSLPTAAALAPAIFLLRLLIYHWGRLLGEDDSALRVIGDWLTSGLLAVVAGPFLDLMTSLSWWISGSVLGETGQLARAFVMSMTVPSAIGGMLKYTFFSSFIIMGVAIMGLLAVAGLGMAFAAANAAMYIMAVLAPFISVVGAVPQMRWLRSLWIKGSSVVALMPIIAGGIFKASTLAANPFLPGGGLLSVLVRLLWMAGSVGFLLSLAGILGKFTLSATVGAFGKAVGAVKSVATMAAVVGSAGVGAAGIGVGAGVGAGATAAPTSGGAATTGMAAGDGLSATHNQLSSAMEHLGAAQTHTQSGAMFSAAGLQGLAQYHRSQAQIHSLAARRNELQERMSRIGSPSISPGARTDSPTETDSTTSWGDGADPGLDQAVLRRAISQGGYAGTPEEFAQNLNVLESMAQQSGFSLNAMTPHYPEEVGRMARAYQNDPHRFDSDSRPLLGFANLAGADNIADILGG
jgi:hypothetical protein